MKRATIPVLAVSGLLVLAACASKAAAPTAAAPATPTTVTAPASPSVVPTTAASSAPVVKKRIETKTVVIAFATSRMNDPALAKGTTAVRTRGVPGVKTFTYEVTFTDGVQTAKRLVSAVVTKPPVTQVIAVGTKEAPRCDPNYAGACVPIASDVDCAGGGGDGPAYVQGPVRVVGTDIYGLDRDHDGIGCES